MERPPREDLLQFIYLPVYERFVRGAIPESVERAFERLVIEDPCVGTVVPGMGGLRKVRVALPGMGKRGGARFLYYLRPRRGLVFVCAAFAKGVQDDLTPDEKRLFRSIVSQLS